MTTINLKDFSLWYTHDECIEVSEEVADELRAKADCARPSNGGVLSAARPSIPSIARPGSNTSSAHSESGDSSFRYLASPIYVRTFIRRPTALFVPFLC